MAGLETPLGLARDLIRFVAARARDAGVDYCYIPAWTNEDNREWFDALRSELPKLFAPVKK